MRQVLCSFSAATQRPAAFTFRVTRRTCSTSEPRRNLHSWGVSLETSSSVSSEELSDRGGCDVFSVPWDGTNPCHATCLSGWLDGRTECGWRRRDREEGWKTEMHSGSPGTVGIYMSAQETTGGGGKKKRIDGRSVPVGDLLVPPPLTRQGVAFVPLPAAGVGVVGDAAARPPHPPETSDTSQVTFTPTSCSRRRCCGEILVSVIIVSNSSQTGQNQVLPVRSPRHGGGTLTLQHQVITKIPSLNTLNCVAVATCS